MQTGKRKVPVRHKQLMEKRATLDQDRLKLSQRHMEVAEERDLAVSALMSEVLGVDMQELSVRASEAARKPMSTVRSDHERLKKKASALAAEEGRAHREAVDWAMGEGGLEPLVHHYLHNPKIVVKCAFEWDRWTTSHRSSSSVPHPTVDDRFSVTNAGLDPQGGEYPDYVDLLHPHVRAYVGNRYWGHAFGYVSQTMIFRCAAPDWPMMISQVAVVLDVHGVYSVDPGDFWSFAMTRTMAAGGDAALEMTIHVSQPVTRPDGTPWETLFQVTDHDCLACYHSLAGRGGTLSEPSSHSIIMNSERREYSTLFPLYGSGSDAPEMNGGGEIAVNVEFTTWAKADYYHADADLGFHEPDHGIKVRAVVLEGMNLAWI